MTHLTILTGGSRGMGLEMARALLQRGHHLITIERHPQAALAAVAKDHGATLHAWAHDLTDAAPVAARLAAWLHDQARQGLPASATLINNAGVIGELGALGTTSAHSLTTGLRVGLEAAVLLTAAFLEGTAAWPVPRKVLNISSGLGRRAMAGSAVYCAAKAGMDHFSRAVALEQAALPNGARIVSLAPGVIDTDMQAQLRGADASRFAERSTFQALHDKGQLMSAATAAAKVLAYLERPDFGANPAADVRDA